MEFRSPVGFGLDGFDDGSGFEAEGWDQEEAVGEDAFLALRQQATPRRVLLKVDASSGTGPDLLPARLLKECAHELSVQ